MTLTRPALRAVNPLPHCGRGAASDLYESLARFAGEGGAHRESDGRVRVCAARRMR